MTEPAPGTPMIGTHSLTKDFVVSRTQTVQAVRGISLQIEPGELVAVLGPNGAGKTTTMRCSPRSSPRPPAPQRSPVISELSGGQRRRLDVAMGLVHAPSLLFLDEPSTGLDPHNRANLWDHILRMRAAHDMTIVLTTHYMDEADSMAERVVIVDRGEVIADDTAEALKAKLAGDRIVVTAAASPEADAATRLAQLAARLPGAGDVVVVGARVEARVGDGPGALPELLRAAGDADVRVATAQVYRPTLDDVFLTLTGRSLREAENTADLQDSDSRKDAA